MPFPVAGPEAAKSSVKADREQKERESENTSQENELGKGGVGQQPLGTQIEPEPGDNAEQKE